MQICKNCVLDERFPGISFDENGVCNFCRSHKKQDEQQLLKEKYEKQFVELISKYKGKSAYDCLVAYSGGKDSSYTLYLLKNKYGLNVLALTYDNWFQSERAAMNIREVIKHLNLAHLTVRPAFDIFKKIMHAIISNDVYSIKALERASSICTTCISLVRFICFQVAIEKNIPFVVFGMSPGQAPIVTSVVKTNSEMIRKMQDLVFQPLHKYLGDAIRPYFLADEHFKQAESFPYSINPLAFSKYDENEILKIVSGLGWVKPKDTDANSTNCLLNSLANKVHSDKFGFNPYAYEMAELVRGGCLKRETALERINKPEYQGTLSFVKKELGLE